LTAEFSLLLFREQTLEDTAAHVARLAVETFDSCDAASVIVITEGGKAALEATNDIARALSGAQIAMAEGPAYDAAQWLRPIVIESTTRERE
jgi:hypothetical protein